MAALPFDETKLSAEDHALYAAMKAKRAAAGAPFAGPYLALMNHPHLAEKIEALGYYLKFEGRLPRNVYQYVVLRAARACDVPFVWVDHVAHAHAAGMPDQVIEAVRTRAAIALPEPYATAEPVVAAALAWQNIPEAAQDRAIALFGREGLVELVVLSGFYQMFAAINQGFAVPLAPGIARPF
jgi:4-carboxymuconolactone decarboxylase